MIEPLYETSATFGGCLSSSRPKIASVNIPEAKKRRQPTKHYVYKIVVQWSNGHSTIIYRRYSMFFDFMVKLQEFYSSLKEKNPKFYKESPLPDLPGKILFGRSQVHQVAEKRRVKVEEFCQTLVSLPPELSESPLVLGFFNTWPEDTLQHTSRDMTSPTNSSSVAISSAPISPTSSDLVISHPDEMEHLEQYRVIADYLRKDSHQVDLKANEIVHVIEKHDTGWWMVVTEEEQGYAPAAHLEAVDKTYDSLEPECSSNEEYQAMESYVPQSEDEIGLSAGDKVVVIHKSMDGWWKIKSKGRTGYCPATIIRRTIEISQQQRSPSTSTESLIYESEKSIYEGLNIHKPPPRKNTIRRQQLLQTDEDNIYIAPKPNPIAVKIAGSTFNDDTSAAYYKVPRPSHSSSSGSDEERPLQINGVYSNHAFSPDHYEIGPSDSEENPIYENTDFDHPIDPSEGIQHSPVYQNMSYDGQPANQMTQQTNKIPIKKYNSPLFKKPITSSSTAKTEDNEYINPEEFAITEPPTTIDLSNKTHQRSPEASPGRIKYVSIVTDPTPPTNALVNAANSAVIKSRLTSSKSLGFPSNIPEDEYVEMDPIYAPVAPDEPEDETDHSSSEGPKVSLVQTQGTTPTTSKKTRPPVPLPYGQKRSPERQQESIDAPNDIPTGRVLQRTKSLEDLLAKTAEEGKSSPMMQRKGGEGKMVPFLQLGRNAPPTSNGYDHIRPTPNIKPNIPIPPPQVITANGNGSSKKPEPAKKSRKPYNLFKIVSSNDSKPEPVISAPVIPTPTKTSNSPPPPSHPPPPPSHLPPSTSVLPKTYIAIEDYSSQAPGCLSFKAGDRCVLVKQSLEGWWYVNVGGNEGWTPGEFWQEDQRAMSVALARPPSMAPQKPVTKPRSCTTAALTEFAPAPPSLSQIQHSYSVDSPGTAIKSDSIGSSNDTGNNFSGSKPLPGRSRGPPPPKPMKPATSSPPNSRKLEHTGSAGEMKFGSPPPPPPPRRVASQSNGLGSNTEYSLLEEASMTPIEDCPWFAGSMEREKAEQFLIDNGRQREFLVRERVNKKGYYALSIRYHYSVKHFNIDPRPDGSYAMGVMQFSSIEEIIKHYQNNSLFVHDGQSITLGQPCRRKSTRYAH